MGAAHRYKFETSRYRRDRLQAAGVPLEDLSQVATSHSEKVRVSVIGGVMETSAFSFRGGTGYILSLTLATTIAHGIAICDWELLSPLSVASPNWMADPSPREFYEFTGIDLCYDLDLVLNHRKRLDPGHSVEGLLLGTLPEPIPSEFRHGATIDATISLFDEMGRRFSSPVSLWISRYYEKSAQKPTQRRRRGLFEVRGSLCTVT